MERDFIERGQFDELFLINNLLSLLTPAERDVLWKRAVSAAFKKTEPLKSSHCRESSIALIKSGIVVVCSPDLTVLQILSRGDLVNLPDLFTGGHEGYVVSICKTTVVYLNNRDLRETLLANRSYTRALLSSITEVARRYSTPLLHVGSSAPARLAATLVAISDAQRSPVINISHDQLSQFVGVSRETVCRILRNWSQSNLISAGRPVIILSEMALLRNVSGRMSTQRPAHYLTSDPV